MIREWTTYGSQAIRGWPGSAVGPEHDEVAMDIVHNNSPILYQSSIDVEVGRHGAYAIFLQSRRYTGLIALNEVLHRGNWMVGIAIVFFK